MKEKILKRTPWGIIAGSCGAVAVFAVIGTIALYLVFNGIAAKTHTTATLFDNWYQTLLFVCAIISGVGLVGSTVMYFVTLKAREKSASGVLRRVFKRSAWTVSAVFFAVFFAVILVADSISVTYESWIDDYFSVTRYHLVQKQQSDDSEDTQYYKSDYAKKDENGNLILAKDANGFEKQTYDSAAMRDHSMDVAERVGEEGSVLMWNSNGALPLSVRDKVSAVGYTSRDWLTGGIGSGNTGVGCGTMRDVFKSRGLLWNQTLDNAMRLAQIGYGRFYSQGSSNDYKNSVADFWVNEIPWSRLSSNAATMASFSEYGTVFYPVARNGGEHSDTNVFYKEDTADGKYLSWTENELDTIEGLCALKTEKKIEKIILLINSATMMPVNDIAKYVGGENGIDACLWVGLGGSTSLDYIADLLVGNENPSGRLPDTWAYDLMSAPANENLGDFTYTDEGSLKTDYGGDHVTKYLVYQEGIYVGYRYYETRYEDTVLGIGNAAGNAGSKMSGENWTYEKEVAFPFGYGKSYTEFAYSNFKVEENRNGDCEVSVTVKNVGNVSGKEVVQIYLQKPYTDYDKATGIEKASVELVGFAKTGELAPAGQPGDSETLTVTVPEYEFKTYDSYGHKTYIIEKGDYYLAAGHNAHDALNNILAKKGKTPANTNNVMDAEGNANLVGIVKKSDDFKTYSVSPKNHAVTNLFDDTDVNLYEGTKDQGVKYLTRKDWQGTYPAGGASLKISGEKMEKDLDPKGTFEEDPEAEMPEYNTISKEHGKLTLIQLRGVPYGDPLWDALLDQMSFEEQFNVVRRGAHKFPAAESVVAPEYWAGNGPCGVTDPKNKDKVDLKTNMGFPCNPIVAATFNVSLVEEMANALAMECMFFEHAGIYGSGANIHRSAYGGRNWEYFSEDGFLTGAICSAHSKGLSDRGIVPFVKHFVLNDQDTNRSGVNTWANEQSMREIYLKGFEAGIVSGYTTGIMTSFNRIGCTWTGRHKGLLTDLLYDEWGFMGLNMTDSPAGAHMNGSAQLVASALAAGTNMWDGGVGSGTCDEYKGNATFCQALRAAVHRNLYTRLDTVMMNGMSSTTDVIYVRPAWEKAILAMEITFGILMGLSLAAVAAGWILWYRDKREIALNRSERKGEER